MTGGMRMDGRNGYWQVLLRVEERMEANAKTKKNRPPNGRRLFVVVSVHRLLGDLDSSTTVELDGRKCINTTLSDGADL